MKALPPAVDKDRPRRGLPTCLGIILTMAAAYAEDLAVLRNKQSASYAAAWSGARAKLDGVTILDLDSSETADPKALRSDLAGANVKVVLAIGLSSAQAAADLSLSVPVVYCMVLNPTALVAGSRKVTGVHLQVSPAAQFKVLRDLVPGLKKVGALYDPQHSRGVIDLAEDAAESMGLSFVAVPVRSPGDVPTALRSLSEMGGEALWMVPDATVYNRDTIAKIVDFTIGEKVPFMAVDKAIVRSGALCALSPRFERIGEQAAIMTKALLSGRSIDDLPVEAPKEYGLYLNAKTASLIGVALDPQTAASATETFR